MSYIEKTAIDEEKPQRFISMPGINRFSNRLKFIMGDDSNRSFARKCGLSDTVIGNYASGKTYPSLDKIELLARAGGCSAEWLATGIEENSVENIKPQLEEKNEEYKEMWASIFERMTHDERKIVIDKVFRYGITALLTPIESSRQPEQSARSQFPWPDDLPEKMGISHNAMVMAMMYDSMSDQERLRVLADIEKAHLSASAHKPSDKQAG